MKRMTLNAAQSAWLAGTIVRNRQYAGLRMMADDDKGGDDGGAADKKSDDDKSSDDRQDKGGDDDKLGEGGKKALQAERDRAKAAEDAAKATKGEFDQLKAALLEGLGMKKDDEDKTEDVLGAVQKQLAAIQHESAVLKLANEHKITDDKDIDLLKSATGPEAMKALAERLAPTEDDSDTKSRSRRPKPDRTQGGGDSGDSDGSRTGSVRAAKEEYLANRSKKKTT